MKVWWPGGAAGAEGAQAGLYRAYFEQLLTKLQFASDTDLGRNPVLKRKRVPQQGFQGVLMVGQRWAYSAAKVIVMGASAALLGACQSGGVTSEIAEQQNKGLQASQTNNIASLSAVITQNPRDADALNLRGSAFGQAGEFQKAIADFNAAIAINPEFYQAYNNRALIHARMGKQQLALNDYNQAISIKPDYHSAYIGRGNIYKGQKNLPLAMADLSKAIELRPDDPIAYFNRGLIHQAMSDHRSAVDDLSVAVNYRPDAPDPHFARGLSYMAVRNFEKAYDDFQTAGTNKVNNVEAWALAGQAAEATGDRKQASRAYKKALQINPSHKVAYEGLRRVGSGEA